MVKEVQNLGSEREFTEVLGNKSRKGEQIKTGSEKHEEKRTQNITGNRVSGKDRNGRNIVEPGAMLDRLHNPEGNTDSIDQDHRDHSVEERNWNSVAHQTDDWILVLV